MKKEAEIQEPSKGVDRAKWFIVFAIIAATVVGNHMYAHVSFTIRLALMIVAIVAGLGVAAFTIKGKQIVQFAKESRTEIRKVVWPTRQETMQTTLIVLAVSVVTALVLWGMDGIMVRLVAFAMGV